MGKHSKIQRCNFLAKMFTRREVDSGPDDTILMEAIKSYALWNELKNGNEKGGHAGLGQRLPDRLGDI